MRYRGEREAPGRKKTLVFFTVVNSYLERDDARVTELAIKAGRGDRAALTEFIQATQTDVWRLWPI